MRWTWIFGILAFTPFVEATERFHPRSTQHCDAFFDPFLDPKIPVLAKLPEDLKPLALNTLLERFRFGPIDHQVADAFFQLRLSGLLADEYLAKMVRTRVKNYLNQLGRQQGSIPARTALFHLGVFAEPPPPFSGLRFADKYDLTRFENLIAQQRQSGCAGLAAYQNSDLQYAFDMAHAVGDRQLGEELIQRMVLGGRYQGAIRASEVLGDEKRLFNIGLFALAHFYSSRAEDQGDALLIEQSLDAFRRIQGEFKAQAERLLLSLSCELSAPEFLAEQVSRNRAGAAGVHLYQERFYRLALRALRGTGEIQYSILEPWIASSLLQAPEQKKIGFVTRISNRSVGMLIRMLIDRARRKRLDLKDELLNSLLAIGDRKALGARAEEILHQDHREDHSSQKVFEALRYAAAARNRTQVEAATRALIEDLAIERVLRGADFVKLLESLQDERQDQALEWMSQLLKNEFQAPRFDRVRRYFEALDQLGQPRPARLNEAAGRASFLPQADSVSPAVYSQLYWEASFWEKLDLSVSREEFTSRARVANRFNALGLILSAAMLDILKARSPELFKSRVGSTDK